MNLYNEHFRDTMKRMDDESIDLTVTSPPYKKTEGYSDRLMYECFNSLYRVQKKDSLFFLNFGHLAEDKFRAAKVCSIAMNCGFELNETITWIKPQYSPVQGATRLNNVTEFIFLLYKGKMPKLDRLAIGVPYECKSNVGRYSEIDLHCAGNVWIMGYETITKSNQKLHPDRFPVELPRRAIKVSGLKTGRVYDPFSGSGTTAVAAEESGLIGIGSEIDKSRWRVSVKRLAPALEKV